MNTKIKYNISKMKLNGHNKNKDDCLKHEHPKCICIYDEEGMFFADKITPVDLKKNMEYKNENQNFKNET